jgi:hypothetical protein
MIMNVKKDIAHNMIKNLKKICIVIVFITLKIFQHVVHIIHSINKILIYLYVIVLNTLLNLYVKRLFVLLRIIITLKSQNVIVKIQKISKKMHVNVYQSQLLRHKRIMYIVSVLKRKIKIKKFVNV